ncbi:MAG: hypothetical protein GXO06_05185 [Epsilonproteobacteria bacterium]|nr:hypothetical protein [Campylobacterota bacterium]
MDSGRRELTSEEHTLYIELISEKKRVIDKEKSIYEIIPKHKRYRVYIGRFFELKRGLHKLFNGLKEAGDGDYLELVINSSGGLINEGQQFYNIIQEKFYGRTVAYLNNMGYSMGALLFCMADKRVVYEYSDLMFHTYSHGSKGKGDEVQSHVEHTSKKLRKFFKHIVVKRGFLTKKEFKAMMIGKDFWMDTEEMCRRGIATHVIMEGKELTADDYLDRLKSE